MVRCPDAATAPSAWTPPAGAEVVWAGAGRECGRVLVADSGREEGGAQAETAGGLGPRLGAEREREAGSSPGWGVEDPGRNFTLGASLGRRGGA